MYRNDLVRAKVVNSDLNITSFAKKAGISLGTARRIWDGKINVELTSIKKVSDYLRIPIHELFSEKPVEMSLTNPFA